MRAPTTYGGPRAPSRPPQSLPPRVAPRSARSVGALLAAAFVLSAAALALVVQAAGWRDVVARGVAFRADADAAEALLATELQQAPPPRDRTLAQVGDIIERLNALSAELGGEPAMSVQGAAVQFALAYQGQHVTPGDYVPLEQAHDAPAVLIRPLTAETPSARFACILVDIDAPDPANPSHSPFLHYVVANLTRGDNAAPTDGDAAPVVVPYYPVSPPMGEHRYVAMLLHQGGPAFARDDDESARLATHRANFDIVAFARVHGLHLVATSTFYSHPTQQHAKVSSAGGRS